MVVSAEKTYDEFGNVFSASGVWKSQFSYAGKFGYQSDPDTGLKLLGHRYYDSDTGRFLTRDPIKDGRNWYTYCGNNPVSFFDAEGTVAMAIAPLALAGPPGWIALGILGIVAFIFFVAAISDHVYYADSESGREQSHESMEATDGEKEIVTEPPFEGAPGSTKVGRKKRRRYGEDGYPEVDRDHDKTHKPVDHCHDWGRPAGGGRPTKADRGNLLPPKPGDPPPPLNNRFSIGNSPYRTMFI